MTDVCVIEVMAWKRMKRPCRVSRAKTRPLSRRRRGKAEVKDEDWVWEAVPCLTIDWPAPLENWPGSRFDGEEFDSIADGADQARPRPPSQTNQAQW